MNIIFGDDTLSHVLRAEWDLLCRTKVALNDLQFSNQIDASELAPQWWSREPL